MNAKKSSVRRWTRMQSRLGRARARPVVLLGLVGCLLAVFQAWTIARILAASLRGAIDDRTVTWLAAFAVAACLRALAQSLAEMAAERAGRSARQRLRRTVLDRVVESGPGQLGGSSTGALTALVVDRIEAMDGFFARYLPAASLALFAPLLVLVAAFLVQPFAGLVLLGCGLTVPVLQAVFGIGAAAATRRQFQALSRLQSRFVDRMRGIATIVLAGRVDDEASRLERDAGELRRRTMRVLRVAFLSSAALDCAMAVAIIAIALHDGRFLFARAARAAGPGLAHGAAPLVGHPLTGHPIAHALFALLLVPEFFAPLRNFSLAYQDRMQASACGEAVLDLPGEDRAPAPAAAVPATPEATGATGARRGPASLAFEHVHFAWDEARGPVLDDLSFSVAPGETAILVGASGSGKSTVMELLLGFVRPHSGRILLDGEDLAAIDPRRLPHLVSWIGQRPMLFAGTLRDNLLLARPEASAAELEAAVAAAALEPVIGLLPQGLETPIGEGGFGLSGGQAQRVAIARAVLRDARLLLLDEPTAHLDPQTELEVLESLRRIAAQRTVLMSSHSEQVQGFGGRRLHLAGGRIAPGDQPQAAAGPRRPPVPASFPATQGGA